MNTLCPFLYPFSVTELRALTRTLHKHLPRSYSTSSTTPSTASDAETLPTGRLNPTPDDYATTPFVDKTFITVQAGNGGNGCISFLREKFVPHGPANGGDGGFGGSVFIQAVRGCKSLNTVAKARVHAAGHGGHGMGGNMGGRQGKDVLLEVPVGTVIREIKRWDPVVAVQRLEKMARSKRHPEMALEAKEKLAEKWMLYPGMTPRQRQNFDQFPELPPAKKPAMAALEPVAPITLNFNEAMPIPQLLAAGALGGVGNPHFVNQENMRPKIATKGDVGIKIALALELKLVADVGLVGLPNAGKSTLLRAVSASRARVGSWAFTTLSPNIGTVVLEDYKARSAILKGVETGGDRTRITIADIPGLIEDAHLNKGLGLEFLRHIERAKVLAFVIDLSAGDGVQQLKSLWKEVGAYQTLKEKEEAEYDEAMRSVDPFNRGITLVQEEFDSVNIDEVAALPPLRLPPITQKPWFVVATKADKPETQENFHALTNYVDKIATGEEQHPSDRKYAVKEGACAVPISAIRGEGVGNIINVILNLLKNVD